MKKLLILLVGCMLALAACGTSDQATKSTNDGDQGSESAEQQAGNEDEEASEDDEAADDNADDATDDNAADEQQDKQHSSMEDITKMPEYRILKDQVAIADYQLNVMEDNDHKRIIILQNKDTHKKEYKSIFIKDNGRLKIVQFNGNGLIYDKTIK